MQEMPSVEFLVRRSFFLTPGMFPDFKSHGNTSYGDQDLTVYHHKLVDTFIHIQLCDYVLLH